MANMADEPGIVRVRIFDSGGRDQLFDSALRGRRHRQQRRRSLLRVPRTVQALGAPETSGPLPHLPHATEHAYSASSLPSRTSLPVPMPPATRIPPASRFSECSTPTSRSPRPTPAWPERRRMLAYTGVALLLVVVLSGSSSGWLCATTRALEAGTKRVARANLGTRFPFIPTTKSATWRSHSIRMSAGCNSRMRRSPPGRRPWKTG